MALIDDYRLDDRYTADDGRVFMTGINALARLPLEQIRADRRAGHRTAAFVSGYQGSPLGGYGEAVRAAANTEPDLPVTFSQGMNEEYAATAVMGSQLAAAQPNRRYDGIVGLWYGKAPGVDRASDSLRHAVFAGTSMVGGAVAIVGDDPNAKSSTVPSSSAGVLQSMHMPLLYPGDPVEALDLGRHAIALSRATGLWSALKIVADVADATASVDLDPDRVRPVMPLIDGVPYQHVPDGRILTPHSVDIEREILEVRYELARTYATENKLNHVTVDPADAWIGLIASGITYREVREALARLGLGTDDAVRSAGIRLLKMGMPMPFNPATMRSFATGLEQIFVIEEKLPNIESLLKDALYSLPTRPTIVGKHDESGEIMLPAWGALDADTIVPVLRKKLEGRIGDRLIPAKPKRTRISIPLSVERAPAFCSGCPHNRSTEVPDGSLVGAGIGCHTMTLFMDESRVGDIAGITAMGNEGTQWIGMAPFVETPHLFQNLGDGTFFHSGQLAIQAAIASGVNITYKLLYNGTVAMTGGQDPEGQLSVSDIARNLLTQGAARVLVTSDDPKNSSYRSLPKSVEVWNRTRLIEAQELLAKVPGVTVLIHDQVCAAEARRDRKRGLIETPNQRVVINPRICEGCGDCGQVSNCLSVQPVETAFGRKTAIDQTTCNFDYSCLEGDCPSFMTVTTKEPGRLTSKLTSLLPSLTRTKKGSDPFLKKGVRPLSVEQELPTPVLLVDENDFAMRITGIGGTGVVTVAQVLGTAAMLDGFHVRGLDQIGLAQKAGPVISDVRLSKSRPSYTNRLGEGQADLLLAFDQLVAASEKGELTSDPETTHVVGSTTATPTTSMITRPSLTMPSPDELGERIATSSKPNHHWADAQAITTELFGSATTANLFIVGMAVQAGVLPIDPDHLEAAIRLNGVAIEANTQALRFGRLYVIDPDAVAAARRQPTGNNPAEARTEHSSNRLDDLGVSGDLRAQLSLFASELEAWGDESTTAEWFATLERVAASERKVIDSTDLLAAVAAGLFKLVAYKDEYEVARLMTLDAGLEPAKEVAGSSGSIAWKLHPPMLRALGMNKKITVGAWATPGVKALAQGKRLRGTALDPFGRAEVRRIERALPSEYIEAIDRVLGVLSEANHATAVAIAELPDLVRGYEDIKLANVEIYRAELADGLRQLSRP
ncbi:MAG: indolepyruvate ferredoxin oxidoreductase family protein [Acidimicrobiia bacterium]|nr:indolepyruvate ferredoxin oxidoreductase family protein [Acidimicrobiia bacterium]